MKVNILGMKYKVKNEEMINWIAIQTRKIFMEFWEAVAYDRSKCS